MRAAGFGFRSQANVESLLAALQQAGGADGLTHIATVEKKSCAAVTALSAKLALPVLLVAEMDLADADVATYSEKSAEAYGTGSVSEAVALTAAGAGAELIAMRAISEDGMATCAIAEGRRT